ncbi:MAG TPA: amidohydrolase family protein [Mycobacteriales bacterium]|jgi:hypothetical protein|nr:amidohydrolase family protein [Mycobacteriales bacterium]
MSEPKLVDVDALLGRHPRRDVGLGTVGEMLSTMDRVGIAEAVVGHTISWLHDPVVGNRQLAGLIADEPRLRPSWVMLPDTCAEIGSPADFVAEALAAGVVAVRAYPNDHGYDLTGPDAGAVLDAVAAAGLPLLVDVLQASWPAIEAVATARPGWPVIACSPSYRALRRIAGVLDRAENVRLALSNFSTHCGVEWIVERFGPDRLLFGSGAPEHDPAEAVTRLLWSELDDDAVAAVGSGNLLTMLADRVGAA